AGGCAAERVSRCGPRAGLKTKTPAHGMHFPRSPILVASITPALIDFLLYAAVAIGGVAYSLVFKGHYYLAGPKQMVIGFFGFLLLLTFGLSISLYVSALTDITQETRLLLAHLMH